MTETGGHGVSSPPAGELLTALADRAETLATAESLTAGLLCATLTDVAGSSAVVRGGLIVYATDLKESLAGVNGDLLAKHGPVHPAVAESLAHGARTRCAAVWGLGLTGVAGPSAQGGSPAGTVHLGVAGPGVTTSRTLQLPGERSEIRANTVRAAIELLLEHVAEP